MSTSATRTCLALCLLTIALAGAGCVNPDAQRPATSQTGSPQNAGEPPAPAPAAPSAQQPARVQATPRLALEAFARLYINWSYRTLTAEQRMLARVSVGSARLSERQAAASSQADSTITRGHIFNRGRIVSITPDLASPRRWVVVTLEQTGGSSQYQGLPESYHVTLARLASVPGGWAVEQWQPQN
jgi:hypothetical protein